jgi:hypothetical protein
MRWEDDHGGGHVIDLEEVVSVLLQAKQWNLANWGFLIYAQFDQMYE